MNDYISAHEERLSKEEGRLNADKLWMDASKILEKSQSLAQEREGLSLTIRHRNRIIQLQQELEELGGVNVLKKFFKKR